MKSSCYAAVLISLSTGLASLSRMHGFFLTREQRSTEKKNWRKVQQGRSDGCKKVTAWSRSSDVKNF